MADDWGPEEFSHWARNSIQSSMANAMRVVDGKLERIQPELTVEQLVALHAHKVEPQK